MFDANVGVNDAAELPGPRLRHQLRQRRWGIPGTNADGVSGPGSADLNRYSGMPQVDTGLSTLGNNDTWTPVWRDERSYTVVGEPDEGERAPRNPNRLRFHPAAG